MTTWNASDFFPHLWVYINVPKIFIISIYYTKITKIESFKTCPHYYLIKYFHFPLLFSSFLPDAHVSKSLQANHQRDISFYFLGCCTVILRVVSSILLTFHLGDWTFKSPMLLVVRQWMSFYMRSFLYRD